MSNLFKVEEKIITLRNQKVIIDSDVAVLYGVQTRDVNKAVANNPEKFPLGYILELQDVEKQYVVENFHHLEKIKFSTVTPKAFTEKGLYMLATILKSKQATKTTIEIVETFAKLRQLSNVVEELSQNPEKEEQKSLIQKGGEIFSELFNDGIQVSETETTFEINFAVMKFKHTVTREHKKEKDI